MAEVVKVFDPREIWDRSAVIFISLNISKLLLQAAPSTPSATLNLLLSNLGIEHIPDASLRLEDGQ